MSISDKGNQFSTLVKYSPALTPYNWTIFKEV